MKPAPIPSLSLDSPDHEIRAFTLSLSTNAGTARGQGHGSFVNSVLAAVDKFYTDVVQHIKPWAPAPPKVRESEPPTSDKPVPDEVPAELQADRADDVSQIAANIMSAQAFLRSPSATDAVYQQPNEQVNSVPYDPSGT